MCPPPLRKFSGEEFNREEGSFDRWIEGFEERAIATGWNDEQRLFQLKAHLEKTAEQYVACSREIEVQLYCECVEAEVSFSGHRGVTWARVSSTHAGRPNCGRGWRSSAKTGTESVSGIGPKEFDRLLKGRFYQALMPKWQRKLGAPKASETFDELYAWARTLER